MTPLIELSGIRKQYGGLRPLRLNALRLADGERVTLRGLDAPAAEMFCLLVTGAALPDEGRIVVAGRETRDVATDTEWLHSLDVFGMVTPRAVLIDTLTVEANLALPLTLSIDPMPEEVRRAVAALADEVGLGRERLSAAVQSLTPADRVRLHLARALALSPRVLILEHITAALAPDEAGAFGRTLATIGDDRGLAWIALTEDDRLVQALGGAALRLDPATGDVRPASAGDVRVW